MHPKTNQNPAHFEVWNDKEFVAIDAHSVRGKEDVLFSEDKKELEDKMNAFIAEHAADETIHVTEKFKEEVTYYKTDLPSTIAVGGLPLGFIPPKEGMKITELLDQMLHPYVIYTWSFATNPGSAVREKGSSINSVTLTANYSILSKPISSIKFYNGSTLIEEHTTGFNASGSKTSVYNNIINSNTTFKAMITDGVNSRESSISHTFVYPAYVGSLDANVSLPNSSQVRAMTKKVQNPGNLEYTYTVTNKRMCVACPPGWTISKIFDPNNFDVTASFQKHTVSVGCLDNTNQNYTVYVSEPTTQTNFKVKFNR